MELKLLPTKRQTKRMAAAYLDGYALGFVEGHRDASQWTKQRIIDDLNHDAVITMTFDTNALERVVRIVEES